MSRVAYSNFRLANALQLIVHGRYGTLGAKHLLIHKRLLIHPRRKFHLCYREYLGAIAWVFDIAAVWGVDLIAAWCLKFHVL